jgi:N-acetyl-anhydromuramyl-L-alanine amidase AmpD
MNIIQIRNSNAFPGRYGLKPRWVILHGTAGGTSAQAIATFFQSTQGSNNPVSAHYVIGQDGQIAQCNDEADGAWANGVVTAGHDPWWSDSDNPNPNNVTISIEHCKPDDANATALTPAQQASSFWLTKDICARNGIPMRAADASGGITGHYSIDPINRARCPGAFDWNALWNYLNSGGNTTMTTIPQGWTDNPQTGVLTAPNGHTVIQGFRGWVLTHNWDPANVPLEEVEAANPVEDYYNQAVNGGTRQLFEYSELAWTSARGVYVVGIGNELRGARKDRDTGRAEIALLEQQITTASQTALGQQVAALQSQVAALQQGTLALENTALKAKIAQSVKDLLKDLQ